ncbi:hypothetical protein BDV26DRAFT_256588 [Aspergillus bertholletiae]|uniref:Secreted protein n=1 Tax=Aspergillus bertholletiae TaxID=1226010 RepID=A0A5N7BGC3_9EURO|nr:hypothetical protein BDV26DRAFT_256588 [Aspergillus bertholletiae]
MTIYHRQVEANRHAKLTLCLWLLSAPISPSVEMEPRGKRWGTSRTFGGSTNQIKSGVDKEGHGVHRGVGLILIKKREMKVKRSMKIS